VDGAATADRRRRPGLMKRLGGRWILSLLVLVIALTFLVDLRKFVWDAASLIHQGFLAIYVDAGSFVSGCF
jgi:hypothetical protein